jgi:hypothetical protein
MNVNSRVVLASSRLVHSLNLDEMNASQQVCSSFIIRIIVILMKSQMLVMASHMYFTRGHHLMSR